MVQFCWNFHQRWYITRTGPTQSWLLWFNFDFPFTPKIAEIEENKWLLEKCLSHSAIKIWQNQGPVSFPLSGKTSIIFPPNWAIFRKKKGFVKLSSVGIKIWNTLLLCRNSWAIYCKEMFGCSIFQFCDYRYQRIF